VNNNRSLSSSSVDSESSSKGSLQSSNDDTLAQTYVYTRFAWPKHAGGEEVFIWGSFNGWTKGIKLHRFSKDHDASVVIPLRPGNYEYKYVVDKIWLPAPFEPMVTNNQNNLNNFRVVAPTINFNIYAPKAQQVLVVGDWDDWQYSLLLKKDPATGYFSCQAHLTPGQYSYQYVVDDEVILNPEERVEYDAERGGVHREWSYDASVFRLFYITGWDDTVLHYRRLVNGQPTQKEFFKQSMVSASSRGNVLGTWKMATVVPATEGEEIEFYLSNGLQGDKVKEDKPGYGALYRAPGNGSYKLMRGLIKPFPRGAEGRIMLVSDIDGTMIGDTNSPDAYTSSARFLDYWENAQALAGSLLVYNTGRSLGQFVELMKRCEGKVAVPDVVITAVGTKVWRLEVGSSRTTTSGVHWLEDMQWAAQLDQHWNLDLVRRAAWKLINHYKDPGMATILDDGSEHRHRMALCVDVSALQHVTGSLSDSLAREGLEVRIIVSGNGSHRYVDCVPMAAGKEKALQYVRKQYGIPEHLCVAAGDSGNDVLMLEGDHPGIVVGNAQAELVHWLTRQPQDGKVVMADAFYADGILEGLARHSLY